MQAEIDFQIHVRENNPISQSWLDQHREDYTFDAWKILMILLTGEHLTNRQIIERNLSNSPTRRFSDLTQMGITLCKQEMAVGYSNRKVMAYWLDKDEIARVHQMIVNKIKFKKLV